MPGVGTSTSAATARPLPSAVGTRVWVTMPCRPIASWARTCPCCGGGQASRLRARGREQGLGDDALQADRGLGAALPLLRGWEDVDDAVYGLRRVLSVQRR